MNDMFKILVVDDEMLIRQGIIHSVDWEGNGYQIAGEASNGEEAIEQIEKIQPDIIITDIVMPKMNGITLTKYVNEYHPKIEMIVLSSFEEFDYVRQTFQNGVSDYILKPKLNSKELLQTLGKIVSDKQVVSRGTFSISIEQILTKSVQGIQTVNEMKEIKKMLPNNECILVELFWKPSTAVPLSPSKFIKRIKANHQDIKCYSFLPEEDTICFILNADKMSPLDVKKIIHQMNEEEGLENKKLNWIITESFILKDQLRQMYQRNKKIRQYHFYLPEQKVLTINDLPSIRNKEMKFDLNHFIYLFKKDHLEQAFTYLKQHIDQLSNQYDIEVFDFKSRIQNIVFNVIILIGNRGLNNDELEEKKYTYIRDLNEAFDISEVMETFNKFLEEVDEILMPSVTRNTTDISDLLDYMEAHYNEPLTLQQLAQHFHFNSSYLSSYFRKNHQEGFSEYLNHIRIHHAARLLRETRLSIAIISKRVGYSDHSYFTKVFKKLMRMSPSNYRKEYSETERMQ
ncbi:response regulator transcription factor [Paraliobacillus sp. PM-2]|uniref:response regulator transcription factor n=1 Tax=Paraliobacillus sp. PM-2 TaxID=1462524 RepID=UPI00159EC4E2|nr:response regulator transcription factor [Paraliobacillus sp. PM-2]